MNMFTKKMFGNLFVKGFRKYNFILNQVRLDRIQYHTCLHGLPYFPSENSKLSRLGENQTSFAYSKQAGLQSITNSVVSSLRKVLKIDEGKFLEIGFRWYGTLEQVNYKEFLTLLNMEDTFYSWFKVMELNAWILLVYLKQEKKSTRSVRKGVMEAFWVDVQKRAKMIDPQNENYKKNITELYNKYKVTLFFYDHGLLSGDIGLANALWNKFFDKNCDDPRKIEALVSYVRYQIHYMFSFNFALGETEIKEKIWTSFKQHYENTTNMV